VDIPRAFALPLQRFIKDAPIPRIRAQHLSEVSGHRKAPPVHKSVFVKVPKADPAVFLLIQAACRDQNMQMGMKIQPASEGVRDDQNQWHNAIMRLHPAVDNGSTESDNVA